jgi:hypothetical protein
LETSPHPKPYPLRWICDNAKLQVTRKCKLRFSITANFVDEVELDVIPLDICCIVLGSPYLYDRKAIFYRRENKYHLFKDGVEYVVRAHTKKMNLSVINVGKMKRLVNGSKNFVLLMIKPKNDVENEAFQDCDTKLKSNLFEVVNQYDDILKNLRGCLRKEESNMKFSYNKIVHFQILVCIECQLWKMLRLKNKFRSC